MLEVRNLRYSYRAGPERQAILHGLDFSVAEGEMVAIQGPSGSGKSTLLYLAGGLLKPDEGTVQVAGRELTTMDETELAHFRNRELGFVFQQFHLLPRATVLENILLPAHYPAETASVGEKEISRARELAALVGLEHRISHLPNQLSGGQQQRVAIARALLRDPRLILADEPTGNLDSHSAAQILELFRSLNEQGRTIVIITHDAEVAARCERVIHVRDGKIEGAGGAEKNREPKPSRVPLRDDPAPVTLGSFLSLSYSQLPLAWDNLRRSRLRSFLTMLGIIIGIAAVLSMITLGNFAKARILDSYADLGVNTMRFYGYRNWDLKATDQTPVVFQSFEWKKDIEPLRRLFPDIQRMTPVFSSWDAKYQFAGRRLEERTGRVLGVNADALEIMGRKLANGKNFNPYQIEMGSRVCLIGAEIVERLFKNTNPLGQVLRVDITNSTFGCRIVGTLSPVTTNQEWDKPNTQVLIPYSLYAQVVNESWYNRLREVLIQVRPNANLEAVGGGIRKSFEMRYGKSGRFRVDADSVLVSQMQRFLTIFTLLLSSIAFLSLAVGGIGIANMMLVSVNERFREIGLRKALGASPASIRAQLLTESVLLCALGGLAGVATGMAGYHAILYGASKLVPKLQFGWVVDGGALLLSAAAILAVGVLSGLFPALKAERLQVIEALRSE